MVRVGGGVRVGMKRAGHKDREEGKGSASSGTSSTTKEGSGGSGGGNVGDTTRSGKEHHGLVGVGT